LKNCANSLYVCGVNRVFCANEVNNLAPEKTGCESCRPSQTQAKAPPELCDIASPRSRTIVLAAEGGPAALSRCSPDFFALAERSGVGAGCASLFVWLKQLDASSVLKLLF
jgi:hypothetical protein